MTGRTYIDGVDIYTEYGAFVTEGGYSGLVQFPPLKAFEYNDWQEEDGIETDLSSPVLDTKSVTVTFAVHGPRADIDGLLALLSDRGIHTFVFNEIGRTFRLRMESVSGYGSLGGLATFGIKFSDDHPLDGYEYSEPVGDIAERHDYEIDGRPLSDYNIIVLDGTLDEVRKPPAVKPWLLRDVSLVSGAEYDGTVPVVYRTKDVKVSCLLRADSLSGMWGCLDALLYDLTRPGERYLYVDADTMEYPCCYKSCSVSEFVPKGRIWLKFSITLTFTSFRVTDDVLLSTEDGALVMTEDSRYAIDMD